VNEPKSARRVVAEMVEEFVTTMERLGRLANAE
jgi:hypothetical protein